MNIVAVTSDSEISACEGEMGFQSKVKSFYQVLTDLCCGFTSYKQSFLYLPMIENPFFSDRASVLTDTSRISPLTVLASYYY